MPSSYPIKSIAKVRTPKWIKYSSLLLIGLLLGSFVILGFIPWQQTIMGNGRVTSFSPNNRPQSIESPIKGRIKKWHVTEGMAVKAGDLILELQDLEKDFMTPDVVELTEQSRDALSGNRSAYYDKANSLQETINNLEDNLGDSLREGRQRVVIAETDLKTAKINLERTNKLAQKGLVSERDKELAIQAEVSAQGNLQRARIDLERMASKTRADITKLQSEKAEAMASASKASDEIAKTETKLGISKVRQDISQVRAPSDGIVVKVFKRGLGETFKENEEIAVITPETTDQAVELFVNDIDAPLLSAGNKVRLQFSGWPAIQFAGLSDTVRLGTFGGVIAVVDNVDSGNGKYRILVKPSEDKNEKWPDAKYLRPGTRAAGWVILKTVPLGYELWRRFNGFPIALTQVQGMEDTAGVENTYNTKEAYSKVEEAKSGYLYKRKKK